MEFNVEEFEKLSATGVVQYFEQSVLASYRDQSEKYTVETDYFAGHVTTTGEYYRQLEASNKTDEYIDVRFGYRTLDTGELVLAVWIPDLVKRSESHISRWGGFHLNSPRWAESDERFASWVRRYLEGSWEVDNGPGHYLQVAIHTINALTTETVGRALFKEEMRKPPVFPSAGNTHRYEDAHKELYGYLIDGLDKEAIKKLARHSGLTDKIDNMNTRTGLEAVFPALKTAKDFGAAYDLVSEVRRRAAHGVRQPAATFAAFEQFTRDLQTCVTGLNELTTILSGVLGIDGKTATARHDARKYLPRIAAASAPHYSINQASTMVGKTVEHVEFGSRQHLELLHESEALIIHFTDGSVLGIDTGSNAGNLQGEHKKLEASDVHVDFILQWVPPKK